MNLNQMNLTSRKCKNKIFLKKLKYGVGFIQICIMGHKLHFHNRIQELA